jgi:hypothetical protein
MEGFHVSLQRNFSIFNELLTGEVYLKYIIDEKIVSFSKKAAKGAIVFDESNLNPHYFEFLLTQKNEQQDRFFIPITMHPIFYHRNIWNVPIENSKRKHSIFMAGNFNGKHYGNSNEKHFNALSRTTIYGILQQKEALTVVENIDTLNRILDEDVNHQCIIVNAEIYRIPVNVLRSYLNRFSFFLACPGVVMPYCHNIVEAMSVGCIPLIQKEYALMMHPPLTHKVNAVFFNSEDDLMETIHEIYSMNEAEIEVMSNQVKTYYNNHLTPNAVINKMIASPFKTFYLLAEQTSVGLLDKARKTAEIK